MSNHNAVAHAWANQTGRSRKGFNMFYEGLIIYSYGRHFPIARIVDTPDGDRKGVILFTSKSYSVSTAKHKSQTRRAIDSTRYSVFEVENVNATTPEAHLCNYGAVVAGAEDNIGKAKRARKNASWYLDAAQRAVDEANAYADWQFLLALPSITLDTLDSAAAAIAARANEQRAAADIARAKAERERALRDRDSLRAWLAGAAVCPPHTRVPYVRVKADHVETTWGATVPLSDALMAWHLMKQARAEHITFSGRGDDGMLIRIGDFELRQITPAGMRVGCHYIPFKFAQIAACAAGLEG